MEVESNEMDKIPDLDRILKTLLGTPEEYSVNTEQEKRRLLGILLTDPKKFSEFMKNYERLFPTVIRDDGVWSGICEEVKDMSPKELGGENIKKLFEEGLNLLYRDEMSLQLMYYFYNALVIYMVKKPEVIEEILNRGVWPFITVSKKHGNDPELRFFWISLAENVIDVKQIDPLVKFFQEVLTEYLSDSIPKDVKEKEKRKSIKESRVPTDSSPVRSAIQIGLRKPEVMAKIIEDVSLLKELSTNYYFLRELDTQLERYDNVIEYYSSINDFLFSQQIKEFDKIYNLWLHNILEAITDNYNPPHLDDWDIISDYRICILVGRISHIYEKVSKFLNGEKANEFLSREDRQRVLNTYNSKVKKLIQKAKEKFGKELVNKANDHIRKLYSIHP